MVIVPAFIIPFLSLSCVCIGRRLCWLVCTCGRREVGTVIDVLVDLKKQVDKNVSR